MAKDLCNPKSRNNVVASLEMWCSLLWLLIYGFISTKVGCRCAVLSFSRPQASLLTHSSTTPGAIQTESGCWERGYLWNLLSMYRSLGWTPHCITGNMAHAYITFGEMEAGETEVKGSPSILGWATETNHHNTTKRPFRNCGSVWYSWGREEEMILWCWKVEWLLELPRDSVARAQKARGRDEARRPKNS